MANDTIAVIFAGGVGRRMVGSDTPKQFLEVGGKPIIAHTIRVFENHPEVDAIVVVCLDGWIEHFSRIVKREGFAKIAAVVPGGTTGQMSIFNGLQCVADRALAGADAVVLVHDGVRPLIDGETITACIASVRSAGCTATVTPAVETILVARDGAEPAVVDRSRCLLARAPQGFRFHELLDAHRRAQAEGLTDVIDSVTLMSRYGHAIHTVAGPAENIKVTTPADFFALKGYLELKESMRT